MAIEQCQRVETFGIGDPACSPRSNSSKPPTYVVPAPQVDLFRDQQPKKRPADVSESDDS